MKIKVFYDHQIFSFQKFGGISRYFTEIIKGLNVDENFKSYISLIFTNNYYLQSDFPDKFMKFLSDMPQNKVLKKIPFLLNNFNTQRKLKKIEYDVFHPTYYDPYFLPIIGEVPFILTVHDMIHEKFPEIYKTDYLTTRNKRILARKASKIIAVSKNTKNDLIQLYNVPAEKIEVIYHGSSLQTYNKVQPDCIPQNYILYTGDRKGYKNFQLFITAAAKLLKRNSELNVVCVGGGLFDATEKQLLNNLNVADQTFHLSGIDDKMLAALYQNALAFVFPSLYEGFGIPILEAFSCDCPLICSDASCFPEIAGDAAEYFDPHSIDSISTSIEKVIKSPGLKKEMVAKGRLLLKKYSLKNAVKQTLEVYKQAYEVQKSNFC
jgi:glycosyltransferase involved in cell wall biosynthesis